MNDRETKVTAELSCTPGCLLLVVAVLAVLAYWWLS